MSLRGRTPSKNRLAVRGLIWTLVIAVLCFFGFTKANPFADKYEIKAAFENVNQLKPNSPVRIAGIDVGKVKEVEGLGEGRTGAVVTMELEEKGLPIKRDATMKVRPRIFLEGNYFVEVAPGSPSAKALEEGETIPATQTAAPVGLFTVLETLQSDTREDLQIVLQEYGKAINSSGGDGYRRSIRYQAPAFRDSAIVNDATLGILEHDLSNYLEGATRFAEGLDRDPQALKDLVTDLAKTADAFAQEQANLSLAISRLPGTLQTGQEALGALVADLRPAVRSSGPSLDATLPFVQQMRGLVRPSELRGLVADLKPLVPNLTELNRGGVALQEEQRLLSSCQNTVVNPWQNDTVPDQNFDSAGPVYQEGVKWLPGIAGESRSFDANGQYVRSLAKTANYAYPAEGGRFFLTDLPLLGVNPPKAAQPPLKPDVACETQERPDLRTNVQAPPRGFRIDQNAPGAAERREQANAVAMDWMKDQLKLTGLDKSLTLSDKPLVASEIDDVRRTVNGE
jgi:phospholipid/cholesterol/gamma-HCH transport system substrate-binding protein